jgi:predicted O-linked N-acetylglucosamine transferase (SPINDLY family)
MSKNRFMYEDYLFEIHASASIMYRGMDLHVNNFLSKCGESLNMSLGLAELIAKDDEEYISKAINYSKNLTRVQQIKEYLVKNRNDFKIFNSQNFADELSNSFKEMISLNKS